MKPSKHTTTAGSRPPAGRGITTFLLLALLAAGPSWALADWPPAPRLEIAAEADAGSLPSSVTAEPVGPSLWRCTFRYRPSGPATSVNLAGTFNGWNSGANPLAGPGDDGQWSVAVELPPGVHDYKFVVNGQQWHPDPLNTDVTDDGHGGNNSVLRLGRLAHLTRSTATRGDGQIDAGGLEHRCYLPLYFQSLASDRVLIRYRTLAGDVQSVAVALKDDGLTPMDLIQEDDRFALYEAQVPLGPERRSRDPGVHRVEYTFILTDGDLRVSDPYDYSTSFTDESVFRTPDWAKNAIWYQIFPDRFRNGDPGNDPEPVCPWTSEWFSPCPYEVDNGQTFYQFNVFRRFYGGDIAGVEAELPYLKELGVNAIYFNPVFKAASNHKYDATNYVHIDDHFGTRGDYDAVAAREDLLDPSTWQWTDSDRRFLKFIETAHAQGFHVIIDGVFNHVGRPHPAFQDVLANGRSSRFADWFEVTSWEPFEYVGWAGFGDLPVFRKSPDGLASPTVKAHIFAVTRRWMDPNGDGDPSDGIDGWRLDVPNEIAEPFWVEWRTLVKSINPNAYITGEIWDRSEMWLDGRHFDAVMNYPFARAVVSWVMDRNWKIKVSEFDRRLRELRLSYPLPATLVLQNLMDSHDTDRVASMALNPDRAYDHANRVQDNGPKYNNAKPSAQDYQRARLAALIQMTYIGAPMVYYGDEVGMWGADDPTCRKPMLWKDLQPYDKPEENAVMDDQLAFYRQVIKLRGEHPALRTGTFQTLLCDDAADVWVFLRKDQNEQLIVALNASTQPAKVAVALPTGAPHKWKGVFGTTDTIAATDERVELSVPPLGGIVLHAATPK